MTGTTDRDYLKTNETIPQNKVTTVDPPRPFLVTIVCSGDDVPVGLFQTFEDAEAFVKVNPPYPSDAIDENAPLVNEAYKIHDVDTGYVLGCAITSFDPQGRPTKKSRYFWDDDYGVVSMWTPKPGWKLDFVGSPVRIQPADGC